MKWIIVFILIFIPLCIFGQSAVQPNGNGTVDDPYQIASLGNLYWISSNPTSWDKYFLQTADIDARETSTWFVGDHDNDPNTPDSAMGWKPIGCYIDNNTRGFSGFYNGNHHTISNLYINNIIPSGNQRYYGLFGRTYYATIEDLGIINCNIRGNGYTGALAGEVIATDIRNCFSTGVLHNSDICTGGLIGETLSGTLQYSNSSCTIKGMDYTGGLIGYNMGQLKYCHSNSIVTGNDFVGGFVGVSSPLIEACYSNSTVYGNNLCGGFAGFLKYVKECYSTGDVHRISGNSEYFGNFAGKIQGQAFNNYATGKVLWQTAPHPTNLGFVGFPSDHPLYSVQFLGNFWNIETSNQTSSNCGEINGEVPIGLTSAQMRDMNTFINNGWSFDGRWQINSQINNGFPTLNMVDLPDISTTEVNYNTPNTAVLRASINTFNNTMITEHGFCYGTSPYPSVADSHTNEGALAEDYFYSTINGLSFSTLYYVRAYATCSNGTVYGQPKSFTTMPAPIFSGSGTLSDPYQIGSYEELSFLSNYSALYECHFIQTQDIDALGQNGFIPIGNNDMPFKGTYDGQNHQIFHLTIEKPMNYSVGLFGRTNNSIIKNLGAEVEVTGLELCGGFVGVNGGLIKNCFVTGRVQASESDYVFEDKCYGGFAGANIYYGLIENCYSTVEVFGKDYSGGFVGANSHMIRNCYSLGAVHADTSYIRGGFIGDQYFGYIDKCYSTGYVDPGQDNQYTYGFVGKMEDMSYEQIMSDNFWDTTSSNHNSTGGNPGEFATGLTTEQMQDINQYLNRGWDFNSVWSMPEQSYPQLTFTDLPTLLTLNAVYESSNSMMLTGRFYDLGNEPISRYGFCLSRNPYPSISDTLIVLSNSPAIEDFYYSISNLVTNERYYYRAFAQNVYSFVYYGNDRSFIANAIQHNDIPANSSTPIVKAFPAYPNPFNPETTISFELSQNSSIRLDIYDIKGRKVRSLSDNYFEKGRHSIRWNGQADDNKLCASGVYFYRLQAGKITKTHKMLLLK